jgi:hypothetical protein
MVKYKLLLAGKAKEVFETLALLAKLPEQPDEKILFSTSTLQVSVSSIDKCIHDQRERA